MNCDCCNASTGVVFWQTDENTPPPFFLRQKSLKKSLAMLGKEMSQSQYPEGASHVCKRPSPNATHLAFINCFNNAWFPCAVENGLYAYTLDAALELQLK